MDYWAKPGLDRQQTLLLYPTLDDCISDDIPCGCSMRSCRPATGRPGRRVSRGRGNRRFRRASWRGDSLRPDAADSLQPQLEYAAATTRFSLAGGGAFHRSRHLLQVPHALQGAAEKALQEIGRLAMHLGLIQLVEVAFDGTRVKATQPLSHLDGGESRGPAVGVGRAGLANARRGGGGRCFGVGKRRKCETFIAGTGRPCPPPQKTACGAGAIANGRRGAKA